MRHRQEKLLEQDIAAMERLRTRDRFERPSRRGAEGSRIADGAVTTRYQYSRGRIEREVLKIGFLRNLAEKSKARASFTIRVSLYSINHVY